MRIDSQRRAMSEFLRGRIAGILLIAREEDTVTIDRFDVVACLVSK